MRVLIVGGGIAGLTAAYWLRRSGHDVRVIERAAAPRADGFMIDFYGPGYAVAEEMGMLPDLARLHREIASWSFESAAGTRQFTLAYADVRRRMFAGRHFNFLHSDLERVLLASVSGDVEVRRGVSLAALRPIGDRMAVTLSDQATFLCDLVIGAGGVHSRTRGIWIDADVSCECYLGLDAAAFSVNDAPLRAIWGRELRILTGPGRQVTVYPISAKRVGVFLVHERESTLRDHSVARVAAELRSVYGDFGGAVPVLLDRIEQADDLYYDAMTQVTLPRWSAGRVVLVGDACQCVSPLGGQGASLAMAGARSLARELTATGELDSALASYERRMRPVVARAQEAGRRMARWVAPRSKLKRFARDVALRASSWPAASTFMRRALRTSERIE